MSWQFRLSLITLVGTRIYMLWLQTAYIHDFPVIRLHGADRKGIEKTAGKDWSRIVTPQDDDITNLKEMLQDMSTRDIVRYVYVNNHFEGSAPRTIQKITHE